MANYTVPAIKGRMGSTVFYQAVMRADELAATVHAAMDFEEFKSFMATEKMQREISEERVEAQIVPYLTHSEDRFFGSILVLVYEPKEFTFEPLKKLGVAGLPSAYRSIQDTVGALTISGGKLFALDGQHRLHALRTVINERVTPRLKHPIDGPFKDDVKSDTLSVIFLEHTTPQKARRIFSKVNRYAKPTTRSTNILMSEDDGLAIVARCVASLDNPETFDSDVQPPIPLNFPTGHSVLRIEGSSLKQNDRHLTTLDLVYKTIDAMCRATGQPALDEKSTIVRPDDAILREAYEDCVVWWSELIRNFKPFVFALKNSSELPEQRNYIERYSVALRPNGQEAIIRGLMDAHQRTKLSPATLVERLNRIPLAFDDEVWLGVLLGGGNERVRVLNYTPLASNLVSYMLIGPGAYGARRTEELTSAYIAAKSMYGISRRVLPKPVV